MSSGGHGPSELSYDKSTQFLHVLYLLQVISSVLPNWCYKQTKTRVVSRKHQTVHMKAVCISLRLTCYKLREELVVAVDDIDRHISGGLQEQRPALQSNGHIFNTFMLTVAYWRQTVQHYETAKEDIDPSGGGQMSITAKQDVALWCQNTLTAHSTTLQKKVGLWQNTSDSSTWYRLVNFGLLTGSTKQLTSL